MFSQRSLRLATMTDKVWKYNPRWTTHIIVLAFISCLPTVLSSESFQPPGKDVSTTDLQSTVSDSIRLSNVSITVDEINSFSGKSMTTENSFRTSTETPTTEAQKLVNDEIETKSDGVLLESVNAGIDEFISPSSTIFSNDSTTLIANQAESPFHDSGTILVSNSGKNPDHPGPETAATNNSINNSTSSTSPSYSADFPASFGGEGDSAFPGPKNNTEVGISAPKALATSMRGVTEDHDTTETIEINITERTTQVIAKNPIKNILHDASDPQNSEVNVFESAETKLLKEPLLDDSRPNDDSAKTSGISKGRSLDEMLLNITVNHHLNNSQYLHEEETRQIAPVNVAEDSKIFFIEAANKKREKEVIHLFEDISDTNINIQRKAKSLGSVQDLDDENQPLIDKNEFPFGLPSRPYNEDKIKLPEKSYDTDQEFIGSVDENPLTFSESGSILNNSNKADEFSSISAPAFNETDTRNTPTEYQSNFSIINSSEISSKQTQNSEGSTGATELFIRLLKENQVLRTILQHITNNTGNNLKPNVSFLTLSTKRSKELDQTTLPAIAAEVETTPMFAITASPNNFIEIKNLSDSSLASNINISDSSETILVIGSEDPDWNNKNISNSIATEILTDNNASTRGVTTETGSDDSAHGNFEAEANESAHNIESEDNLTSDHTDYNEPQPIVSHNEEDYDEQDQSLGSSIRKCCGPAQFFSLDTQSCAESGGETYFRPLLHQLVLGDTGAALVLMPGRLQVCPGTGKPPEVDVGISNYTHLLDQGFLYDIARAKHFDHGVYCLELVGHDPLDAQLTAAFCPSVAPEISVSTIRKCCPLEEYYDTVLMGCAPKQAGMKSISDLVHDFSGSYTESTSIETGRLTCQEGAPDLVDASKVYLGSRDQLCVSQTGRCYPSTLYCIEYMWAPDDYHEQPSAVFCPLDSFQKCCPPDQIVLDDMCVDSHVEYLSPFITQLMATLNYQVGFPINDNEVCVHLLLDTQDEIRWWVTNSGFLVIDSDDSQIHTKNYCVDDSLEPSGDVITLAHVCSNELKQSIVLPLSVFEKGTIGKCCQPDHHLSPMHQDCAPGGSFNEIDADPLLKNASITALGYTGYPHCQSGTYFLYTFTNKTEDHVEFGEDSMLYVVSRDGECIERATPVEITDFCVDYGWDAEDPELPAAIVCAPGGNNELHTEKYNLTAALLGVSCFSLLIALVSLISMRVRRGLVTIRKMNTLAGRILISYVTAHLIGFLTLAVSMHIDVHDNTASCMLIAAVMQFFLLAGFCWNTSICSESLLLTLRVSTSEGRRFLYHSLWAWGVPAIITSFALTMDSLRHSLPCGTITPRIGRFKCFFSDPDAALLYFYLPIALTLIANLVLLITSRRARLAKLKRLERGPAKPIGHTAGTITGAGGTQASRKASLKNVASGGSGGMRTHQNRNLWSESLRLVLWSGGTWLFEVIGFVAARYISPPQERWYDYLWYLPASINSLRGFGIFFILVMTDENRGRIVRALGTMRGKSSAMFRSDRSKTVRKMSCTAANSNNVSMSINSSGYTIRNPNKQRNMSVATNVTSLPAFASSVNQDVHKPHARVAYSISQVQRQNSTTSSQSSNSETEEHETMEPGVVGIGGGRRRSSVAPVSLPSVDEEEDDFVETSLSVVPLPQPSPPDSVFMRDSDS